MALDPLVLTLALDDASQARFDELRRRWFPPGRTQVGAHVTLFHALPGDQVAAVLDDVREACARPGFRVEVSGLRFLGRGVAYGLEAPQLQEVHAALARRWRDWLTPQDRQPLRPHVTVQNKVAPEVARATLAELSAQPLPPSATAAGLSVWHYRGGPWEPVATEEFYASTETPRQNAT